MSNFFTPSEVIDNNISGAVTKGNLNTAKMIFLGIMAGMFIAFGGAASSLAVHTISDVGIARTLAGTIFPVGLILIVLVGGELFTGNCLMSMALVQKQIKLTQMLRNLVIVYISNFIGAFLVTALIFYSGQFDYTNGALGAYTIKVALGKATLSPSNAVVSGILCNILVCCAILTAGSAKDISGKILAIFFPIWAFVICGFEHCVANMFYIPAGMLAAANPDYAAKAEELYGITSSQIDSLNVAGLFHNLIPVTIGNIIGGAVIVGGLCILIYKQKKSVTQS